MSEADISLMTSFINGATPKDVLLNSFEIGSELFDNDFNSYNMFLEKLSKLTWIVNKHYRTCSNENRKIIMELIKNYLVYYFNYLHKQYDNFAIETGYYDLSPEQQNVHSLKKLGNILQSLSCFITRLHYRIKYFDLKSSLTTFEQLQLYIADIENTNNETVSESNIVDESINTNEELSGTDIFNINREQINIMLQLLQSNETNTVKDMLENILTTEVQNKSDTTQENSVTPLSTIQDAKKYYEMINKDKIELDEEKQLEDFNCETNNENINIEIVSNEEVIRNLIQTTPNYKIVIKPPTNTLNSDDMDIGMDENVEDMAEDTVIDNITESEENVGWKEFNGDEIAELSYDNAWNIDSMTDIKNIINYLKSNYEETPDNLKYQVLAETRYIAYLLTFMKAEAWI